MYNEELAALGVFGIIAIVLSIIILILLISIPVNISKIKAEQETTNKILLEILKIEREIVDNNK